jgi:hypothetical protein
MTDKATDQFLNMLDRICERPGMYVGERSLRLFSAYMGGYEHALEDNGLGRILDGFAAWVFLKYDIYSPAWHWTRVLHHSLGTEQAAIARLPTLVREFLAEREMRGGADWFNAELGRRFPFLGKEPDSTTTPSPL